MKKKSTNLVDTVFWLAVAVTVMLSWSAVDGMDDSALTGAFTAGAVGLITFIFSEVQES